MNLEIKKSLKKIMIKRGKVKFDLKFSQPLIFKNQEKNKLNSKKGWKWFKREESCKKENLPDKSHQIIDFYQQCNFILKRFIWKPPKKDCLFLKWVFKNESKDKTIRLDSFQPTLINIIDSQKKAQVFRQGRFKNDCPEIIEGDLTQLDIKVDNNIESLLSDPFVQMKVGEDKQESQLLAGFLTFKSQLCNCEINRNGKNNILNSITTVCELDGIELSPGKKIASELLWINWENKAPYKVLKNYVNTIKFVNKADSPTKTPPSVYLSWYYLRDIFFEEDLNENLEWLKNNLIPLDVIQIDNSWEKKYGDWEANKNWPSGMKNAATKIKDLGYTAGLWTCPYLAETDSKLYKQHPNWILKNEKGNKLSFKVNNRKSFILDPTHPEVLKWLEEEFDKYTRRWGFKYHKLDFMRVAILDKSAQFYDSTCTRAEAYRRGLKAIRKGTGDEAYILICGGLYGSSLGLADGQRTGSDVHGKWDDKTKKTLTQSLFRTWMTKLWNTDPDALMIRKRRKPFKGQEMSLGFFNNNEAKVLSLNQYLSGGIVSVSERLVDFNENRLKYWSHIIPSLGCSAIPRDLYTIDDFPSIYHCRVSPKGKGLDNWHTLTLLNTSDEAMKFNLKLDESLLGDINLDNSKFLIWDFFQEEFFGYYKWNQELPQIEVSAHDAKHLRLVSWKKENPILLGTNLHFSGGGVEIDNWKAKEKQVEFTFQSEWMFGASVWIAFPAKNKLNPNIIRRNIQGSAYNKKLFVNESK